MAHMPELYVDVHVSMTLHFHYLHPKLGKSDEIRLLCTELDERKLVHLSKLQFVFHILLFSGCQNPVHADLCGVLTGSLGGKSH